MYVKRLCTYLGNSFEYWEAKFARNKERDAEVRAAMAADGWHVVEIWECELKKKNRDDLIRKLKPIIGDNSTIETGG